MNKQIVILFVSVLLWAGLLITVTAGSDPGSWSISKKMSMAKKYQAGFKKKASGQLAAMEKNKKMTPQQLGAEMQKYNAIINKYNGLINGLKLPCSSTAEARKNRSYMSWWSKFAKKDKAIHDSLFARVKKIMTSAGLTPS